MLATLQEVKIPKKIHYCWFGNGKKSELILKCMKTWSEKLQDYEIVEWNEDNFDINCHPFVKRAYEEKKWAHVSDFVRAYVIYNEGGIYLDTDVEITNSLDKFLKHSAFTGFETKYTPFTAVFGAEKNNQWVKDILDMYSDIEIEDEDGNFNMTTNTMHVSSILINKYKAKTNDKYQILDGDLAIYPSNVLCRPSKKENYAIHHCNGSWIEGDKKKFRDFLKKSFGNEAFLKMMDLKAKVLFGTKIKKVD